MKDRTLGFMKRLGIALGTCLFIHGLATLLTELDSRHCFGKYRLFSTSAGDMWAFHATAQDAFTAHMLVIAGFCVILGVVLLIAMFGRWLFVGHL